MQLALLNAYAIQKVPGRVNLLSLLIGKNKSFETYSAHSSLMGIGNLTMPISRYRRKWVSQN